MTRPAIEGLPPRVTRHVVERRRFTYRGRELHSVSYDESRANAKRALPARGRAWWLMSGGTRWEVMPFHPGQPRQELHHQFKAWLEANVFAPSETGGG